MSCPTVEELATQVAELRQLLVSLQGTVKEQQDEIGHLKRHVVRLEHELASSTGSSIQATHSKVNITEPAVPPILSSGTSTWDDFHIITLQKGMGVFSLGIWLIKTLEEARKVHIEELPGESRDVSFGIKVRHFVSFNDPLRRTIDWHIMLLR